MRSGSILVRAAVVALLSTWTLPLPIFAAQHELRRSESFPVEPGAQLVVDVTSLDVAVRSGDVPSVQLTTDLSISGVGAERAAEWLRLHTPTVEAAAGRLLVTARPGRPGFLGLGHLTARARLELLTPATVAPDLTTTSGDLVVRGDFPASSPLLLRTTTGDLEFDGAAASLDLRSSSGNARLRVVRPLESLVAHTAGGSVDLTGGARQVQVETASGAVWLANLSGSAKVSTASGRITLEWDRLEAEATISVRTSSGKVHIELPPGVSPRGHLTTTTGTIRSDFPGVVNEAGDTVSLTGVGPMLEVESATGEIILTASFTGSEPATAP